MACMIFAHIRQEDSLRDIDIALNAHANKLYHIGIQQCPKSTLGIRISFLWLDISQKLSCMSSFNRRFMLWLMCRMFWVDQSVMPDESMIPAKS